MKKIAMGLLALMTACQPSFMGEKPSSDEGIVDTASSPADDTGVTETEDSGEPQETDSGSQGDTAAPADDTGVSPSEDTGEACESNCGDTGEPEETDSGSEDDTGDLCVDEDNDGHCLGLEDCDDHDPSVNERTSYWYDNDGDGFGGAYAGEGCGNTGVGVDNDDDCDDYAAAVNPDATEVLDNSVDEDCDGTAETSPEDTAEPVDTGSGSGCTDADGDGYCSEASGGSDCDDGDEDISPAAIETANDGIDQDCSGSDLVTETDADGDGYGVSSDCDDSNSEVYPGAAQQCRSDIDYDCDGLYLYDDPDAESLYQYTDDDGDGYGSTEITGCSVSGVVSSGESNSNDDCDDSDSSVNPGESEVVGDGIDQDCDGSDDSIATLQDEAECEDAAAACFVDVDEDGDYETLLMDGGQWDLPELEDADAEIYENGYGTGCGIDGDTVESNSAGYYVISFSGLTSSCTSQVSLVSGGYWWQNYDFCEYDDVDGICVATGSTDYMIGIDYRSSSGLQ